MTELEQQLQAYAAKVEELKNQNTLLTERLRATTEKCLRYEGKILAMGETIDRCLEKIADR